MGIHGKPGRTQGQLQHPIHPTTPPRVQPSQACLQAVEAPQFSLNGIGEDEHMGVWGGIRVVCKILLLSSAGGGPCVTSLCMACKTKGCKYGAPSSPLTKAIA
jgi:hypothetical protein